MSETQTPVMPLVSIVIPVYNVQRYIGTTIDSILAQEHEEFELILVDDGSDDESPEICDHYASLDPRIRVIHKKNEGVSIARNTGIAQAKGEYLAFVDGDDELYPYSLSLMVQQAMATGADVVSGNVRRTKGTRSWQSWHHKKSHTTDRSKASLAVVPELLYDTVIWNKLYRLDFWRNNNFSFPHGVIFEDMFLAFQAYEKANHVDIISEPIYQWRVREEESSATQQKGNVKNVVDRELALSHLWTALKAKGNKELIDVFLLKLVEGDLWFNVSGISEETPEFNEALCRLVRTYWKRVPSSIRAEINVERRTIFNALSRGRALEVPGIRQWFADNKYSLPIRQSGSRLTIDRWKGPKFVRTMRTADRDLIKETSLECVVTDVSWTDQAHFQVDGWAFIPLVDVEDQQIQVLVTDGTTEVSCTVERSASPMAYSRGKDPNRSFANAGFRATVDVTSLVRQHGQSKRWNFIIRLRAGKVVRESALKRVWRGGSASVIGFREINADTRVVPINGPGVPLRLDIRRPKNVLQSVRLSGRTIEGVVTAPAVSKIQGIDLVGPSNTESVVFATEILDPKTLRFTAEIPETDQRLHSTWRFRITTGAKDSELAWSDAAEVDSSAAARGLSIDSTPRGWAVVHDRVNNAVATSASVNSDLNLRLIGNWSGPAPTGFVSLRLPSNEPKNWIDINPNANGDFDVLVPLQQENWYGELRPYPSAKYDLVLCTDPADPESAGQLVVSDSQALTFPLRYSFEAARVQLDRARWAKLTVRLRPPISDMEQGAYERAQRQLRWAKPAAVEPEKAVFFRTDMGGSAGDSALAIQQELMRRGADLKYYWAVKDNSIPIPPGGEAVIDGSEKWTEKIARSQFIVNNYGAVQGYLDHDHQVYVQTWHGTPLKIIGLSEWRHLNGSQEWLEQKREAAGYWDYLVTASPFTTELFPPEFLFEGKTLELGMPRNDRLALATNKDRDEILQKLGIDPRQKVVLYAPTYRDYLRNSWRAAAFDGLDMDDLTAKLGPEWTVITRGHSFNKRAGSLMKGNEQVVDATFHPDISELYMAADACITDYSSVMFDFSVSRKPLFFFVPDLEDYLSTRPMYMDLAEIAPSPLCMDLDQLVGEILDMDNFSDKYGADYEAFRVRFAPHDDGYSAQRVVDEIFKPVMEKNNIAIDK
ncbi:bifunctional glycosyltransferase/CDP-glycerol:glycerophosphate glycerophosphotransferase [Glutamicibacter ardleyensis]|uniref:bifunctional glycosyltransferase/CDP-glycerol:glycerophosphate glycerophosphotransferase n=1 Tax=Glutamicibacter ardleyensis TaxID=225894 RepID=UPI003FCFF88C